MLVFPRDGSSFLLTSKFNPFRHADAFWRIYSRPLTTSVKIVAKGDISHNEQLLFGLNIFISFQNLYLPVLERNVSKTIILILLYLYIKHLTHSKNDTTQLEIKYWSFPGKKCLPCIGALLSMLKNQGVFSERARVSHPDPLVSNSVS